MQNEFKALILLSNMKKGWITLQLSEREKGNLRHIYKYLPLYPSAFKFKDLQGVSYNTYHMMEPLTSILALSLIKSTLIHLMSLQIKVKIPLTEISYVDYNLEKTGKNLN